MYRPGVRRSDSRSESRSRIALPAAKPRSGFAVFRFGDVIILAHAYQAFLIDRSRVLHRLTNPHRAWWTHAQSPTSAGSPATLQVDVDARRRRLRIAPWIHSRSDRPSEQARVGHFVRVQTDPPSPIHVQPEPHPPCMSSEGPRPSTLLDFLFPPGNPPSPTPALTLSPRAGPPPSISERHAMILVFSHPNVDDVTRSRTAILRRVPAATDEREGSIYISPTSPSPASAPGRIAFSIENTPHPSGYGSERQTSGGPGASCQLCFNRDSLHHRSVASAGCAQRSAE